MWLKNLKNNTEKSKHDECKKYDKLKIISWDEIIMFLAGFIVFIFFDSYKISFIILVILWHWFKIRYYEGKIIEKERDIYNININ